MIESIYTKEFPIDKTVSLSVCHRQEKLSVPHPFKKGFTSAEGTTIAVIHPSSVLVNFYPSGIVGVNKESDFLLMGLSVCRLGDQYDENLGRQIAFARAIGTIKGPPKYVQGTGNNLSKAAREILWRDYFKLFPKNRREAEQRTEAPNNAGRRILLSTAELPPNYAGRNEPATFQEWFQLRQMRRRQQTAQQPSYSRPPSSYTQLAARTDLEDYNIMRQRLRESPDEVLQLLHMAIGLATEAGELLDQLKKHLLYGKPLDWQNVREELGDSQWYAAGGARACGTSLEDVQAANLRKLQSRFPSKFSEERALNRNTEREMEALDNDR